jgi:hypothetical protein
VGAGRRGQSRCVNAAKFSGPASLTVTELPSHGFCQGSRHRSFSGGIGLTMWTPARGARGRCGVSGAGQLPFRRGPSAPPRATRGSAAALAASSSTKHCTDTQAMEQWDDNAGGTENDQRLLVDRRIERRGCHAAELTRDRRRNDLVDDPLLQRRRHHLHDMDVERRDECAVKPVMPTTSSRIGFTQRFQTCDGPARPGRRGLQRYGSDQRWYFATTVGVSSVPITDGRRRAAADRR